VGVQLVVLGQLGRQTATGERLERGGRGPDGPHGDSPHEASPHGDSPHEANPHGDSPHGDSPHGDSPRHGHGPWGRDDDRSPDPTASGSAT